MLSLAGDLLKQFLELLEGSQIAGKSLQWW